MFLFKFLIDYAVDPVLLCYSHVYQGLLCADFIVYMIG